MLEVEKQVHSYHLLILLTMSAMRKCFVMGLPSTKGVANNLWLCTNSKASITFWWDSVAPKALDLLELEQKHDVRLRDCKKYSSILFIMVRIKVVWIFFWSTIYAFIIIVASFTQNTLSAFFWIIFVFNDGLKTWPRQFETR